MATFHLSANMISRKKNQSVVASASYRACEKIKDERLGEVFDYTRKKGLELSEIITPDYAPDHFKNRTVLWNEVEKIEKRKDAQLARNLTIALPCESSPEERKELLENYVDENFTAKGMIADVAIHAPHREGDERNFHAHILLTTREITPEGFGKKDRDWNKKELLEEWRKNWAKEVNDFYKKNGIEQKIDHRSHDKRKEEAIAKGNIEDVFSMSLKPQKDIGYKAFSMERRGIETDKGIENREIKEKNQLAKDIWESIKYKTQSFKQKFIDFIDKKNEPNKAMLMEELKEKKPVNMFENWDEKLEKAREEWDADTEKWRKEKQEKAVAINREYEEKKRQRKETRKIERQQKEPYKTKEILTAKDWKDAIMGKGVVRKNPKEKFRPELEEIRKNNIQKLQNSLKWHEEDWRKKSDKVKELKPKLEFFKASFEALPSGYGTIANLVREPEKYGKIKKGLFGIKKETKATLESFKMQRFGEKWDKAIIEANERNGVIKEIKEEISQEEKKPYAELQKQFDLQQEEKARAKEKQKDEKIEKMINALDKNQFEAVLDDETKTALAERLKADDKLFKSMEISYDEHKKKEKSRGFGLSL